MAKAGKEGRRQVYRSITGGDEVMIVPHILPKSFLVVFYQGQDQVHSMDITAATADVAMMLAQRKVTGQIQYSRLSARPRRI